MELMNIILILGEGVFLFNIFLLSMVGWRHLSGEYYIEDILEEKQVFQVIVKWMIFISTAMIITSLITLYYSFWVLQ